MKTDDQGWRDDFPIRQEVEDCAGTMRQFAINCYETSYGFTVRAEEKGSQGSGYEFAAYSETSPYAALGRMRQKMHRALATRHISGLPGDYQMLHDRLSGRITCDRDGGLALVVDGISLQIEDLASILRTHEGWTFELQIVDALE